MRIQRGLLVGSSVTCEFSDKESISFVLHHVWNRIFYYSDCAWQQFNQWEDIDEEKEHGL